MTSATALRTIQPMRRPEYPSGYDSKGRSLYYKTESIRHVYGAGIVIPARSRLLRIGQVSDIEIIDINNGLAEPLLVLREYIRMAYGRNLIPTYIFDDHNHAFYAWYEAFEEGLINHACSLYHIDDHPDTTKPITPPKVFPSLQEAAEYTQELPVNSFIAPAVHLGIVKDVHQYSLENLEDLSRKISSRPKETIIDIDLDVFTDSGSPIEPTPQQILNLRKIMHKAGIITIATNLDFTVTANPEHLDQNFSLNLLQSLLSQ